MSPGAPKAPLLDLRSVSVHYPERSPILRRVTGWLHAVDDVSLSIAEGECLALVGESGCGKTTLGRAALGFRDLRGGQVIFDGQDISALPPGETRRLRRDLQLIFQDPYASLDPQATIGAIIRAPLDIHGIGKRSERPARVAEMMRAVGLNPALSGRYPHEFSGGMRQRVVIARALILNPRLLVCDEPTSALDVSIQAQILNLLLDLRAQLGLTYLFISHDLAVVEHVADRVAVMYFGRIVEIADRDSLFADPRHPYTRALIDAIPIPDPTRRETLAVVEGDPPESQAAIRGCPFRSRCPRAFARCREETPPLMGDAGHKAACWLVEEEEAVA